MLHRHLQMNTIKLTLEYEGTAYAGWQRQPDHPTIQAALEDALAQITQTPITTVAAGRTDAGVHALGQVVSFRTDRSLSSQEWSRALNGVLPQDIAVLKAEFVSESFHARYSASGKLYEYRILNAPCRPALQRNRLWHVPKPLDIPRMAQAATAFLGKHDFSSFQGSPTDTANPICLIEECSVSWEPPLLRITIKADRFLKQMVRAIVGTLVEVGHGKRVPSDISKIIQATDRRTAGTTAPPHGLYLVDVMYACQ